MKKFVKQIIAPLVFHSESSALSKNGYSRIYHNHIRKCAGSSINLSIISSLGGSSDSYVELSKKRLHKINLPHGSVVGWNKHALNRDSFFYGFSHTPLHELTIQKNTFCFSLLRDPSARLVSHYKMLKDLIASNPNHPALKSEEDFAYGDFDHFLDNIPREHLEAQLYNFSEKYCIADALKNLLGKTDYVDDISSASGTLVPFLSAEFNLSIPYSHERKSRQTFVPTKRQMTRAKNLLRNEIMFIEEAKQFCGSFRFGRE